jgi:ribosomal protein S18 acetylase RimI-like enzyme
MPWMQGLKNCFITVLLSFTAVAYSGNMSPYTIHVDYEISEKDAEAITQGLSAFNTPFFGNKKTIPFMICLKNENQKVLGGILAWMRPGIGLLCVDTIWVAEHLRHQGYGTKLMRAAEAEGLKQGCTHSQLETLPFQAAEFYQKLGYVPIGRVEKLYGDHDAIYMRKKLAQLF